MIKLYKILIGFIMLIQFLSICKITEKIEGHITSYPIIVFETFISRITRINWQYGFFTSKSKDYQYISTELILVSADSLLKPLTITQDGAIGHLATSKFNAIRLNTLTQQIVRDSIYLEAGSRSIALYLFNKYPKYQGLVFEIIGHGRTIKKKANYFELKTTTDTLFNKVLSY